MSKTRSEVHGMEMLIARLKRAQETEETRGHPDLHHFTPEQVKALLGGEWPDETGFCWDYASIAYFILNGDVLDAYDGYDQILPAPGIRIDTEIVPV